MSPLRALLAGLAVLALCGCQTSGGTHGPVTSKRLERILESRELRVGLSASQPPLNMRDKRGEIIGLDVDLVEALAHNMGLRARLVTRTFSELLTSLEKDEVDMVISGMTITPERNARVAFAGPYFISGKSLLTKSAKVASVERAEELDDPSRTYVALAGSTSEDFVKTLMPRSKLVTTPD